MYLAHHKLESELFIVVIIIIIFVIIIIIIIVVIIITTFTCSASFTALMSACRPLPAHTLPKQCEKQSLQSCWPPLTCFDSQFCNLNVMICCVGHTAAGFKPSLFLMAWIAACAQQPKRCDNVSLSCTILHFTFRFKIPLFCLSIYLSLVTWSIIKITCILHGTKTVKQCNMCCWG